MALTVTFHVFGDGGQIYIEKNRVPAGTATPGHDATVSYNTGEYIGMACIPYSGYKFVKLCDDPQTECSTNPNQYRPVTGSGTVKMVAYFSANAPQQASFTFRVVGNGQLFVEKNRSPAGTATPGSPVTVTYNVGDYVGMACIPYTRSTFVKLCDVPQTECSTNPNQYRQVTSAGNFVMEATFTVPPEYKYECLNGSCQQTGTGTQTKAECQTTCAGDSPGLSVNGKRGSVGVPLNTPVTLAMTGIGANTSVMIVNVSATPDETIAQGTTDANGNFVTSMIFSKYEVVQIRGYSSCISFVCAKEWNTVTVTAGEDESLDYWKWVIVLLILVVVFFYSKELGLFGLVRRK
ncbi:MAG TPA: hypothetical protein VN368_00985 [Candidatus Methylomirabilis sp.]|nr:hypothetical protein [Candidatus Methylomirabilis sp.]